MCHVYTGLYAVKLVVYSIYVLAIYSNNANVIQWDFSYLNPLGWSISLKSSYL